MTRPPSFTPAQRYAVAIDHGAIVLCQICGGPLYLTEMQIDHHLAVIDGGKHERENWRPVCRPCHKIKSAREHRMNAKCKRVAKKHSGQDEPTPPAKGRAWASRPWPESKFKKAWPSRPFQRREG